MPPQNVFGRQPVLQPARPEVSLLAPDPALQNVRQQTIEEDDAGQRLDNYLFRFCKGVPKSHVYRLVRSGQVRINGKRADQTYKLQLGDVVRIPPVRLALPSAQDDGVPVPRASFPVLFEDADLLIIDKPSGVAVHGGSGVSFGVIEQLRASRPDDKFLELVHRLDRDTSGVLMLAKKRSALVALHEQMREGQTEKRYFALVAGKWPHHRQHVRLPLHKYVNADGERRVSVQADGLPSHTIFSLIRQAGAYTLLDAELKTGRTHQIRVHLAAGGFPIVGDDKYGNFELNRELQKNRPGQPALKRMFLHARRIRFVHPRSKEMMSFEAPLPPECVRFLDAQDSPNA